MSSWVRYCVAVYVGLLISGALARPPWTYPSQASPPTQPVLRTPERDALPEGQIPSPDDREAEAMTADNGASDTLTG